MALFAGQLNTSDVFSSIYNMIIGQVVNANNIADGYGSLVSRARSDGGLYGDTKLFYSTDILKSHAWGGDSEATNLLAVARPDAPHCQAIVLDVFRQIDLSVDDYLSKRAWSSEGAFTQFNGVLLGWLKVTKQVYDETTYNAFIGTAASSSATQNITVTITPVNTPASTADEESAARIAGQKIAEALSNLVVRLKKPSRLFNDLGFMRSYKASDLEIIWNAAFVNMIEKIDLPTIFHDEKLVKDFIKEENILPSEYFGNINAAAATGDGSTIYSLIEQDITVGGQTYHVFPGELIPTGGTAAAGTSYTVDSKVICKVTVKELPPYMSAFEVGTSFFNAKALLTNHYLTWGHNTLERFDDKPFITVKTN